MKSLRSLQGRNHQFAQELGRKHGLAVYDPQSSTSVYCFSGCAAPNARTPTFPSFLPSSYSFGANSNLTIVDPGFQTPYILDSSLEIQRGVLPNTTVTIGTLWTHGVHLIASSAYDLNLIPPTGTTTYTVCPGGYMAGPPEGCIGSPGATVTEPNLDNGLLMEGRISSQFGQINALISPGINNYNSLYVEVQRRAAR